MKNTYKKNKGFSLMELLIAIAILSIIMVAIGSFMTTTLHTQSKTSKEIEIQDEAQRIYYQMADILMQATYIRVEPQDGTAYTYEKVAKNKNADNKEMKAVDSDKAIFAGATTEADKIGEDTGYKLGYVSENYPNYQLSNVANASQRKVIVSYTSGNLYNEKDVAYPKAGSELDGDGDAGYQLKSFRVLNKDSKKYYVKPKYIYIEYSNADTAIDSTERRTQKIYKKKYANYDDVTEVSTEVEVVTQSTPKTSYVIFMYDELTGALYMSRSDASATVPDANHCFAKAVEEISKKKVTKAEYTSNKKLKIEGLVSSNVKSLYISANPDENSFDIDLDIENSRYSRYHYDLKQTVNFRNDNVLTTKPQLRLKWKGDDKTATENSTSLSSGGTDGETNNTTPTTP